MSHPSLFNHLPLHLTNTHILPKLDLYSLLKLNFILKSTRNDASKFENVHGLSNKKYLSIVENIEKSLVKLKICEISFCEVVKGRPFSVILYSVGRMRVIDSGQGSDGPETSSKWFLGNFSRGASGFGPKNIDLGPKNV